MTLVGEFAGKERAGTIIGISSALLLIGNIVGPPSLGHLIDTTGSYQTAWQVLAILALLATVLLLFVREERRRI